VLSLYTELNNTISTIDTIEREDITTITTGTTLECPYGIDIEDKGNIGIPMNIRFIRVRETFKL